MLAFVNGSSSRSHHDDEPFQGPWYAGVAVVDSAQDANSHNNRGIVLADQGKLDDAIQDYKNAIDFYSRLVEQEGRAELANDLAKVLNNRGNALRDQGKLNEAISDYQKAIEILARLVEREGRTELANVLAGRRKSILAIGLVYPGQQRGRQHFLKG